jgi:hypothetical protein
MENFSREDTVCLNIRPRISSEEAKLILEILEAKLADLKEKLERLSFLRSEAQRFHNKVILGDTNILLSKEYNDTKRELAEL